MAMIDHMAEQLSRYTGTKFTVRRGRLPGPHHAGMFYALDATRGDHTYHFWRGRPQKLNQLTHTLATICDMVNMGFIPVSTPEPEPAAQQVSTHDQLMATIERRGKAHEHIIASLAHYSREEAMSLILGWISIDSLYEIAPTLAGSPVPEASHEQA